MFDLKQIQWEGTVNVLRSKQGVEHGESIWRERDLLSSQ
jgi:hypothetical protein